MIIVCAHVCRYHVTARGIDCNRDFIAVSESYGHCITLVSMADGSLLNRFGEGLQRPRGIKICRDNGNVLVADLGNHRVCKYVTPAASNIDR